MRRLQCLQPGIGLVVLVHQCAPQPPLVTAGEENSLHVVRDLRQGLRRCTRLRLLCRQVGVNAGAAWQLQGLHAQLVQFAAACTGDGNVERGIDWPPLCPGAKRIEKAEVKIHRVKWVLRRGGYDSDARNPVRCAAARLFDELTKHIQASAVATLLRKGALGAALPA